METRRDGLTAAVWAFGPMYQKHILLIVLTIGESGESAG